MAGNYSHLPPGLNGFIAEQDRMQEQQLRRLQMQGVLNSLSQTVQHQRDQEAFRKEIEALGPNAPTEAVMQAASKYMKPEALLELHTRNRDREAQRNQQALQFAQNLDVRQQQLDLQRDQALQRTQDEAERRRIMEQYNTARLENQRMFGDLNTQLRAMGLEITRQGQQLQLQRFDAEKVAREEREIEGAIGKTADRMKDVGPVFTSAKQLNDSLSLYTPQNVPGVGYLKNTDIGKFFLSDKGKDVSASIKQFGNSLLKAMSGAAVTAPEEIRNMAAQMADGRFSAEDFYIAWPKMTAWVNDQVSLSTAGLTPKARERFLERTGLKLDPITPRFLFDPQSGTLRDTRAPQQARPAPQAPRPGAVPPPPPGFSLVP